MSKYTFQCEIYFNQIALFQYGLENPFNDWNDTHVNQGFSWREGSVSFGTLTDNEDCEITVELANEVEIDEEAIRAIVVPFTVEKEGIEVGSVMETTAVEIPSGKYELLFTVKKLGTKEHYTFSFVKNNDPVAKVLRADSELEVSKKLLMEANPAI